MGTDESTPLQYICIWKIIIIIVVQKAEVSYYKMLYMYLYALSPGYFQVSFVVLVLKEGTSLGTLEIVTLAVGIPYTLFWCILGWCMVGIYI